MIGLLLAPTPLWAQPALPAQLPCRGERVSIITILTQRPSELQRAAEVGVLASAARRVWTPTDPEVVRGFLRVAEGQRCTELARAESERLLRVQPFIADARIRVIPLGGDSIGLAVETRDEFPLDAGIGGRNGAVSRVRFGTLNLSGDAIALIGEWEQGFAYRDGIGGRIVNQQVFGQALVAELSGRRDPLGGGWDASLRAPFYTDLQRQAWYVGADNGKRYIPLRRPTGDDVMVGSERTEWLAAFGHRLGTPRRSGMLGVMFEGESVTADPQALVATDSGAVPYGDPSLAARFDSYTSVRGGATLGLRFLTFTPVRGFDALTGPQDIGRGTMASVRASRSLWSAGGIDRDVFVGGMFYSGTARGRYLVGARADVEGRRPRGAGWDGVIGSGRAAWYLKLTPRVLHTLSAELSGAWRNRLPFQLSAADPGGGLRGYGDARTGGARRLVVRVEERWVIPPATTWMDLGVAAFADGGRVWGGDAPLGVTTPVLGSVGLSLLAAAPAGSKRVVRLDIGFPLVPQPGTGTLDVRLSVRDLTRLFWSEPMEVTRGRQGMLRERLFRDQ